MHGWPLKCTHNYCCPARCTHCDRHPPAYSQFSCVFSVITYLFSMCTCGCVRLYALKVLACCARYFALRRSLPRMTRTALLTVMRSRPLHTAHDCVRLYTLKLLACCARYLALRRNLPHLTRAALLTAMCSRLLCTTRGCVLLYALKLPARCARSLLSRFQQKFIHNPYHLCDEPECTGAIPAGA